MGPGGVSRMPTSAWQVRRMVEGSRPIFSQWRSSTALLCEQLGAAPDVPLVGEAGRDGQRALLLAAADQERSGRCRGLGSQGAPTTR